MVSGRLLREGGIRWRWKAPHSVSLSSGILGQGEQPPPGNQHQVTTNPSLEKVNSYCINNISVHVQLVRVSGFMEYNRILRETKQFNLLCRMLHLIHGRHCSFSQQDIKLNSIFYCNPFLQINNQSILKCQFPKGWPLQIKDNSYLQLNVSYV